MQTFEANSKTDYGYFPIEYPTSAFSTLLTTRIFPGSENTTWVITIDKQKFLTGNGCNYITGNRNINVFNLISIGF